MRSERAASPFVTNLLPQRWPRIRTQNVGHRETHRTNLKVQPIAPVPDPFIPLGTTAISGFLFVEGCEGLLVTAPPKPWAVRSGVLQDRCDVVQAVDHVADKGQSNDAVGSPPESVCLTTFIRV